MPQSISDSHIKFLINSGKLVTLTEKGYESVIKEYREVSNFGGEMKRFDWLYRLGYTSEGNLSQYLYSPLRTPGAIRLLELYPGQRSSAIQCEIVQRSLEEPGKYEALSYSWGDLRDTKDIRCNGRNLAVTNNLHTALENLRHPDEKRTFWVDAVCINQRDYTERNQQIRLMSRIYKQARQVPVWIGEMTEDTKLALDIIAQLNTLKIRLLNGTVHLEQENLTSLGLPGERSRAWGALRYFFRRPWFQRVWVIQETANASKPDILCGEEHLEWDDVVYAARCIKESSMFAVTDTALICEHICFMDECREAVHHGPAKELSLLNLLYKSRRCSSTDPRDKIYGLYPLVDSKSTLPDPDYGKSIASIYKETTVHLLKSTGNLAVLSCGGAVKHASNRALGLPSWVPDWRCQDKSASLAMTLDSTANGDAKALIDISEDLSSLSLRGKVLDEVTSLSDTMIPFHGSIRGEIVNWILREWPDATATLEPSGENVRILEVFRDSVFAGEFDILSFPSASFNKGWLKSARNEVIKILYARRVFRSISGHLGLAPSYASPGDMIVVLEGGSVPYVIRPQGRTYTLVGEAFVQSYMNVHELLGHGDLKTIVLV